MSNNVIVGIIFMAFSVASFIGLVLALVVALEAEKTQMFFLVYALLSVVFCRLAKRAFKGNKNVAKA
ncbi:hypothetical protein bcgnr5378_37920 [Bacillus cereus]|uniref:Group-specific protein n=1 Tax=Bacillus cereus TaxID=1396 RepID=A0A162PG61_BACCE|nr:hypothetical protein [Bacillus cereus]KZD71879.1 hypothetical protein B4088_0340 [Bacillus cereus]HDR8323258.1 hypothetical protein [Bacillus cereus]HDR8331366.1 hypothetical protein [Bacillus cereus]HDR8335951.1 hypothetical protein [Bacillus cereus]